MLVKGAVSDPISKMSRILNTAGNKYLYCVLFQVDLGQYLAMYRSQVDGDPGEEGEEEGGNTDNTGNTGNTDNTGNTGNTDNTTTSLQNDIQQGPSEVRFYAYKLATVPLSDRYPFRHLRMSVYSYI
jgi:hypothetical protein